MTWKEKIAEFDAQMQQRSKAGRKKLPVPILALRCEWCKLLFQWTPPKISLIDRFAKTCSLECRARLRSWKEARREKAV